MTRSPELQQVATDLCADTRSAYRRYSLRTRERTLDGSPASVFETSLGRKIGPSGDWDPSLARKLSTHAHLYMTMAEQHLLGLECLLEGGVSGLPLGPAARSVAESSGRAGWLLDHRLALNGRGARRRVARYVLDSEENYRIRKQIAADLGHPERAKFGDEFRAAKLLMSKPGLFYPSEIERDSRTGKVTLCGEKLPGPSGFVHHVGELFGDTAAQTSGYYGYVSSMTHPTLFAFAETLVSLSEIPHDSDVFPYRHDWAFALQVAANAVRSFYNCWRAWVSWTNTDLIEIDEIHTRHTEALEQLRVVRSELQ